jgi:ATP-dependent helicase/nuclease subunit B
MELLFQFYEVYKNIEKEEAKTFEEFSKWAPTLLADFNEIDNYLADAEKLFSTVNQIRAIEVWNVGEQEPTPIQLQFLAFWEKLFPYYKNLKSHLHSKNLAFQGMAARHSADNIQHIATQIPYLKIFFAGFNALNKAEEKIIQHLTLHKKAELFWDTDAYYMDNEIQEAGIFLRNYKQKWFDNHEQKFNWLENYWRSEKKEIHIIGTAKNLNQVKAAGEILSKLPAENNFQDTAVVLADENLLMPLLNSIPDKVEHLNVTMGMPLKYIPLYNLLEHILLLHENAVKHAKGDIKKYRYYHSDIRKLLQHPLVANIWQEKEAGFFLQKLDAYIRRKNRVFIDFKELESQTNESEKTFLQALVPILNKWDNKPQMAIEGIKSLLQLFKVQLAKIENKQKQKIEAEYLFLFSKICNRIERYIKDFDAISDIATLRVLFNQVLRNETLAFYGEPLKGLQVMGVLETRTLDFETIIITSANEGILPSGKTMGTMLPFDIKKAFGLPTYSEKDSIFAYHFYRLLQRAKTIYLIYNTEADELGGGEKSRFISQIQQEIPEQNSEIKISQSILTLDVPSYTQNEKKKEKNELVLQQLFSWIEKGISPSALNTYITCPLDFYYKYVLKLRDSDEDEVEENIEASTMGNYMHNALQIIYTPFINKVLNENDLLEAKFKLPEILKKEFLQNYTEEDISSGKNLLTYNIAEKQLLKFLDKEIALIKELKKANKYLTILALEENFETEIPFNCNGKFINAKLAGRIDRIDKIGNTVRVLDYKTGAVNSNEVSLNSISQITDSSKALQLFTYALLYQKQLNANETLEAGIVSFRKQTETYFFLNIDSNTIINTELINNAQLVMQDILEEIFNTNIYFEHNPESSYCSIC